MYTLVPIALVAWIPITLILFAALSPRRAVLVCFIGGWMFLPMGQIGFEGYPNLSNYASVSIAALLGVMLFDMRRLTTFKPHWVDLPIIGMCLAPIVSALVNGFGAYDGASALYERLMMWGLPYFIGRLYFSDAEGMRELAIGLLLGAIVYTPLALFEIRMSPQLHNWVYGYFPSRFTHSMRFGGFRPIVFMQSGLMVGFFLAAGSLVGAWMYVSGALRRFWGVELLGPVIVLLITTVLAKALGAIGLLIVGLGSLTLVKGTRWRIAIWIMVLTPLIYIGVRSTGLWSGEHAVNAVAVATEARAQSLEFRFEHETELAARAWERPVFGWGRWGDARIRNDAGKDLSVTDGLWIITFGNEGLFGLASVVAFLMLPSLLLLIRCPPGWWYRAETAPAAALAVIPLMFAVDSLLNAMVNPVWPLVIGALGTYYMVTARAKYRSPFTTVVPAVRAPRRRHVPAEASLRQHVSGGPGRHGT